MKNILKSLFILFISLAPANAACDFMINIGDKGTKIFEKIAPPMPMFEGQFMLPVQAPELCPNDNLNENIAVEYIYLGENPETALRLAAIRMVVLNDGQNTESDKLTLMKYAKKVYGDFDTGQNPKVFNNYMIWEKNNSIVIYKRMFNQEDLIALRTDMGVEKLLPGITGWAQVNGRDELSISEKVALDVEYLKRQSLLFDVKILCMTFFKVINKKGVSH